MLEARITCQCRSLKLPDLGLELVLGQVEYAEATKAKGSKDLARARRASGVMVEYVERVKARREPSGFRR